MKKIMAVLALLLVSFGLVACDQSSLQKITFETNQGTTIDPIEFSETYDISRLSQFTTTKEGYTFVGWFTNASLDASSALTANIEKSITLYAKWELVNYSITYHLNEGVNASGNPSSFTILDTVNLQNPTRSGYVFAGWHKDAQLTQVVTSIPAGSKANVELYAKWSLDTSITYNITWQNEDGSVLKTEAVAQGSMPAYVGTPTKAETETHTFTFAGWSPSLSVVSGDQIYVATYTMTSKYAGVAFTPTALNAIFGFDVYALMPGLVSQDYLLIDASDPTWFEVYIDFFDWDSEDADAYMALLDQNLTYDDTEESWVVGDYYIYLYEDPDTYPGLVVYGIVLYGEVEQGGGDKADYNPTDLNALFGYDIYALMPAFQSNDAELFDYSDGTTKEVYIDIFDWVEADALAYMDLLDALLPYDDVEESWVIGNYFLYVYADDETYPGQMVYGIGIYGESGSGPVDPVEGVYYAFNVQNTTSAVAGSYRDTLNQTIVFPGSDGKVIIKVNQLANITGATPSGLSTGMIFAATVSGNANGQAFLEIDTLGQIIQSMTFEIEARDGFSPRLAGAKVQTWNGSAWVDLVGGNFYSQLSTDMKTITVENINSSKFRLLFVGNGDTSNGGQVKISNVQLLSGSTAPAIESWSDMIQVLGGNLNESSLATLLPELEGITNFVLAKINNSEYKVTGNFAYADHQTRVNNYIQSLLLKGYLLDSVLSSSRGQNVYALQINNDLAYALYVVSNGTTIEVRVWKFDPVVEPANLATITTRQTINQYEVSSFGKSGLPSTGKFDVLVIPVEIKDNPFPSDYVSKLDLVFNGTASATGWQSVASYYYTSSWGILDITFDIAPKYTTLNNKSYYQGFSDEGDQYAIVEALNGLNSQIDYSQYDSNNDGQIDSVIFIYSVAYSDSDPWWAWVYSAQYGVANSLGLLDGKKFDYYFWASYTFMNDSLQGLSGLVVNAETYVHELGHLMGMPDLYPYSDTLQFGPVGGFDMMDYNSGDHGPFNKLVYGWLQPLLATTGSYQVTLDAYSTDNDGLNNTLLIPYRASDLNDGNAFDEYLLVMFYTPNGLYTGHLGTPYVLNNAGIVIYHVDARMNSNNTYWGEYFLRNNSGTSNFIVQLLEADFNNSIPTTSNSGIAQSDILTSGSINLSTYRWSQGGAINVTIEIAQAFNNNSTQAVLNVNIS